MSNRWPQVAYLASLSLLLLFLITGIEITSALEAESPIFLPVVRQDTSDGLPSWSSPIALHDRWLWTVNPDSGSVSQIDTLRLEKVAEIPVGQEPWSLVIAPEGSRLYILDRAGGTLVVVDALSRAVIATVYIGSEPGGVALSPTGSRAYVTGSASNELVVIDTHTYQVLRRIPVAAFPYALAITDDGDGEDGDEQIYVTHLFALPRIGGEEAKNDGREGQITVISAGTAAVTGEIPLVANVNGFPNLLSAVALSGRRAWIPLVRAMPELPLGFTTTIFASVSTVDLLMEAEDQKADLPLNDQSIFGSPVNNPAAAIPSPDGRTLYIVLAGSNLVEVVDVAEANQPRLVRFLPVGVNPRGMALDPAGQRGYVMNYLSRSITVLDLNSLEPITDVTVTDESLEPTLLQGKILFNNAADPRLSQGSWLSCASCHPDGGSDSVTWIFPDGPRQTPPLWNAAQTLPWHWSAALDEAQDVEETIQRIQHGLGLARGVDPPLLGAPLAGRSAELDALALFMANGIRSPVPPPSRGNLQQGRELFQTRGCGRCHGGTTWTASALPGPAGTLDPDGNGMVDSVLHEVGTLNPRDVRGRGGFDPPSLLGIGMSAPYFHDGSMPTLEALLRSGHPGGTVPLDAEEVNALVDFLNSIGPTTPPIDEMDP